MVGRAKKAKLNDSNSVLSLRSRQDSMSYAAMRCRVTKPWLSKRWRSCSSSGVVIAGGSRNDPAGFEDFGGGCGVGGVGG